MKIRTIEAPKVIMSNPLSRHNYFGWPSIARLKNGRIVAGASGYRTAHICPFGKGVVSFSEDEGNTYTIPAPVIDTIMDDRDVGFVAFGKSGLIVTSFTNSLEYYKMRQSKKSSLEPNIYFQSQKNYRSGYLESIDPEEENKQYCSYFRISYDNGITFGPLFYSPISSPHGPLETKDGTILWVGAKHLNYCDEVQEILCYTIDPQSGEMAPQGKIDTNFLTDNEIGVCEPHAVQLSDGSILCHIRAQRGGDLSSKLFTLYQSRSYDNGVTWSKPVQILDNLGGAPAHLLVHSSGTLICSYARRHDPIGIYAMFSNDLGETWDIDHCLHLSDVSEDIGYPCTVELNDGTLATVFYSHDDCQSPALVRQLKWQMEK